MPIEQQRGYERKQRILDAALDVFSHRGYQRAAVDEIAGEARTSKGGLYFHFPSKQSMFLALLDRMASLLLDRMESALQVEEDPSARLDAALRTAIRTFAAHKTLARLFLIDALGAGHEFDARLAEIQGGFAALIKRHLDEAVVAGAIPPLDTGVTSVAWFGAVNQIVTRWVLLGQPTHLEDAYPALRALLLRSVGLPVGTEGYPGHLVTGAATRVAYPLQQVRPGLDAIREKLEQCAAGVLDDTPVLLSATERVPWLDPLALFDAAGTLVSDRQYWENPGSGFVLAGIGTAYDIEGRGDNRFHETERAWTDMLQTARMDVPTGVDGTGPLLLGGFSFDTETRHRADGLEGQWRGFPDGRFVLPRLLLTRSGDETWLTVNVIASRSTTQDEIDRVLALWTSLFDDRTTRGERPLVPANLEFEELMPQAAWKQIVARAVADIRGDTMEKVVLARAVMAHTPRPLDPTRTLRQLRNDYAGSGFLFAVARGSRCFLGSTPERLVRLSRGMVQADSLAGSTRRGATVDEDWKLGQALLDSAKDQAEHAVVTRVLRESLEAAGARVLSSGPPGLRKLGHLQHLHTPLMGQSSGCTILDFVARVHPTPAVGGFPRDAALAFVRNHECLDRGWYASPIGWIDRHREGEFAVGIRSAFLDGSRVFLYAGCGIVGDSDPNAEYAESCLKLRPMRSALSGA